jgi:hypothetical protein
VTEAFLGNFPQGALPHALISSVLLLYETGGEAALYGAGRRTRRTAKKITDGLQTRSLGVNKRPTGDPTPIGIQGSGKPKVLAGQLDTVAVVGGEVLKIISRHSTAGLGLVLGDVGEVVEDQQMEAVEPATRKSGHPVCSSRVVPRRSP